MEKMSTKRHRQHCRLLISGPSGSGKSFMASQLAALGYPAFDSDEIPGLAAWYDASGAHVRVPDTFDGEFLKRHRFLWDEAVLSDFLAAQRTSLLLGISHNSADLAHMFDRVFLLTLPVEQVLHNLRSASRTNRFGGTPEHQAMARDDTEAYYQSAPAGWLRLMASSPESLIEQIEQTNGCRIPRSQ